MTHFYFIDRIINVADTIKTYIQGLSFEEFKNSRLIIDAVIWNLEFIGEEAKTIQLKLEKIIPIFLGRR
jgi:uncharacterized protein with HEPN domain